MSNYNERLDTILQNLTWKQHELGTEGLIPLSKHEYEAKQDITSLIKELVAEAKPEKKSTEEYGSWEEGHRNVGWNNCLEQFEQNLLKELEEV